jgi:crossover junction endodeoxyribonuclease RuvC
MSIIGIDIGVVGAIAVLSSEGELLKVEDMPLLRAGPKTRATVSAPLLAEIVRAAGASHAFVEHVGARRLARARSARLRSAGPARG